MPMHFIPTTAIRDCDISTTIPALITASHYLFCQSAADNYLFFASGRRSLNSRFINCLKLKGING